MKKPFVYAAIIAAIVIFAALTAVYQIRHPGRPIPSSDYTENKVKALLSDYTSTADLLEISDEDRNTKVFAAMMEVSTPELEKSYGVTAAFYLVDINGAETVAYSNGSKGEPEDTDAELIQKVLDAAADLFDDSFKVAEDTDFNIPDYDHVRIYLRRGERTPFQKGGGIYFKDFTEDELPQSIKDHIAEKRAGVQ